MEGRLFISSFCRGFGGLECPANHRSHDAFLQDFAGFSGSLVIEVFDNSGTGPRTFLFLLQAEVIVWGVRKYFWEHHEGIAYKKKSSGAISTESHHGGYTWSYTKSALPPRTGQCWCSEQV